MVKILACALVLRFATTAAAETPTDRAKKIVDAQVAALVANDDTALAKTFTSDAVLILGGLGSHEVASGLPGTFSALVGSFHAFPSKGKVTKLAAGGSDAAIWIAGEITIDYDAQTSETSTTKGKLVVRISELAIPDKGTWKVAAAQLAPAAPITRDKSAPTAIDGLTTAGPLAKLLVSPKELTAALSKDAGTTLFGTDQAERAYGPAAVKKQLAAWSKLTMAIEGQVREVRTASYGFVQANVNLVQKGGAPYRMRALLIALPDGKGGWTVGAVHYGTP